jgi:outer membrane protein OmpU
MTLKKLFLGTTALLAAGLVGAGARAADPIKLTLGGFYGAALGGEIGGADKQGEPSFQKTNVAFHQNVEVYFNGQTTLDNGLTAGVHIELEANNQSGRTIDEVYTYFRGGFGDFRFGDTKSANDLLCIWDPGSITNNFGLQSPNTTFTNVTTNAVIKLGNLSSCIDEGQAKGTKAIYYSPVFSGLQFGASFQPHQGKSAGPVTGTASTNNVAGDGMNIITAGLNYKHNFGAVSLLAGGGIEYWITPRQDSNDHPMFLDGGFQLTWGKLTVGASGEYMWNYIQSSRFNGRTSNNPVAFGSDAWVAAVGANYVYDAWTFALEYMHGAFQISSDSDVDVYNAVSFQTTYKLGPGIRLESEIAWFDWNEDQTLPHPQARATSNSVSVGLGTYMTF